MAFQNKAILTLRVTKKCQSLIICHQMCSFKRKMHQNPFSAGGPPRSDPAGGAYDARRPSSRLKRGTPPVRSLLLDSFGVSISPRSVHHSNSAPMASHLIWTPHHFVNPESAPAVLIIVIAMLRRFMYTLTNPRTALIHRHSDFNCADFILNFTSRLVSFFVSL